VSGKTNACDATNAWDVGYLHIYDFLWSYSPDAPDGVHTTCAVQNSRGFSTFPPIYLSSCPTNPAANTHFGTFSHSIAHAAATDMEGSSKKTLEASRIAGVAGISSIAALAQNLAHLVSLSVRELAGRVNIANVVVGMDEGLPTAYNQKKHGVVVQNPKPKPVG
jgi:hypothetical protein